MYAVAVEVEAADFAGIGAVELVAGPVGMDAIVIEECGVDDDIIDRGNARIFQGGDYVCKYPAGGPAVFFVGGLVG